MIEKPNKNEIEIMSAVQLCIKALYKIESVGGCCHIVVDDGNVDDDSLKYVIDYCNETGNTRPDRFLSMFICEQLLTLKEEYRIILYNMRGREINSETVDAYFRSNDVDEVIRCW